MVVGRPTHTCSGRSCLSGAAPRVWTPVPGRLHRDGLRLDANVTLRFALFYVLIFLIMVKLMKSVGTLDICIERFLQLSEDGRTEDMATGHTYLFVSSSAFSWRPLQPNVRGDCLMLRVGITPRRIFPHLGLCFLVL